MKSIAPVLASITLASIALASITAASISQAAEQGIRSMDNATRTRIVAAAIVTAGNDWQAANVEVRPDAVSDLDRNGCTFMVAANPHVGDGMLFRYALLPDGRIAGVDIAGNAATATVLRLCGQGADANWWAQIIARFSEEAAGVFPVSDGSWNAFADLVKAGLDVKPPMLTRVEGATTVEFFACGPGGDDRPLHIRAKLPVQGDLTVTVMTLDPPG